VTTGVLAAGILAIAGASTAHADQPIGLPVIAGNADPVPPTGVEYGPGSMMQAIFRRDLQRGAGSDTGHDFWMDRMLMRTGTPGTPPSPTATATAGCSAGGAPPS